MKESYFQSQVIMLAKLHGWLVMHTRAVEIRPGVWKTPLTGHPGYPDLTLGAPIPWRHICRTKKRHWQG
jgi:hypothetical protein